MYISTMRWTVAATLIIIWAATAAKGQRSWETIPRYDGLQVKNGMLAFSGKPVFDQVYDDLERRIREWYAASDAPVSQASPEQPCPDDNAVLSLFEQTYRHSTARKANLLKECEWLNAGRDPGGFEGYHLADEILGSLFNDKFQVQVGADIYYCPLPGLTYIVANEDLESLRALERGENPYNLRNVQVFGPETGCSADFSVNTDGSTTTVGFAHTGLPQAGNVIYFWEFGDGNISMQKNPVHTYSQAGQYTVCLTIESALASCTDRVCKTIQVGTGGCLPFFIFNETGQPGGICFLDNTQIIGNVVSWNWSFGDGSPGATQANPCHVFPCDKTYFVTLAIETSSGCSGIYGFPVVVDSYGCCSANASLKDDQYYAGNTKKIKFNQRHVQIPLLYHRIVASVINYKLKSNGKWAREEANLQIDLFGNVFLPTETGCQCDQPFQISKTELAFNKKQMTTTKAVGKAFKAKKTQEWGARYYVNNALIAQKTTPVTCD